jgi:SAM-dependent methyltransferase
VEKEKKTASLTAPELPLTMSAAMASVTRYHEYLWSLVAPWLGQRVMEIGVGYGQYTRRMLAENRSVLACDLDRRHLGELVASLPGASLKILCLDLENPEPQRISCAAFAPDSIMLLNVLEHIREHEKALAFLREVAVEGAVIVLIVPALPGLYNALDREAGHHRRYTRRSLERALATAGWTGVASRYVNLPGVAGWLAAGLLGPSRRNATALNAPSTNWLLRLYDRFFVGLSRATDAFSGRLLGLSVVAVARKR